MKKLMLLTVLFIFLIGCGEAPKKSDSDNKDTLSKNKTDANTVLPSADYSTLLTEYNCDMDIAEVAKVLEVAESDLSIPDFASPGKCYYSLKGFGEDAAGGTTLLMWGPSPSSKGQNKKEIRMYLKNQEELPKSVIMGMSIALADTKDCYIAQQPAHGRIIIYNENYDTAFLLHYGHKRTLKTRTPEQQDELKAKMTKLANYLLKKHGK